MMLFVGVSVSLSAQTPTPPAIDNTRFDVVSVKRNVSGGFGGGYGGQPGGRFVATNMPPATLVLSLYAIQRFQLVGAPEWLESERYDINAVAEGGTGSRDRQNAMLRNLLADRFKLVTHKETRTIVGHALVPDKSDGRLGPRLKPVTVDCEALRASGALAAERPRLTMNDFLTPRPCSVYGGAGMFVAGNVSMDALARDLVRSLNAPVMNATGLTGDYEVVLRWNSDPLSAGVDQSLPSSLPIALREQLGLKLEPRPLPVEVVVIDRIERPSDN